MANIQSGNQAHFPRQQRLRMRPGGIRLPAEHAGQLLLALGSGGLVEEGAGAAAFDFLGDDDKCSAARAATCGGG